MIIGGEVKIVMIILVQIGGFSVFRNKWTGL
jgi:hypothetical protein